MRNDIEARKKRWERTKTFKRLAEKINKRIAAIFPFELQWQGPGYMEKYLIVKITQPINHQTWKDIWQLVESLQENTFGKPPKGRPREKSHSYRNTNKKVRDTLEERIKRGKERYGSHVDSSWRVNFPNVSINRDVSEGLAAMSRKGRMFLVYTLSKSKKIKKSNRELARMFGVNKGTIQNWILAVEDWTESERKAVVSEVMTSKILPDRDVSEFPTGLVSFDAVEYLLTNKGIYNTGQKKKPRSPDKNPE